MMVISRELYDGLVKMITGTINSSVHIMTQEGKEAYLNHAWRLVKEYERKVIIKEQEEMCWDLLENINQEKQPK